MTSTIPATDELGASEFPMARATGCPFDPPPQLKAIQEQGPPARVRLGNGTTPWLVTRYAEQRAVLSDPRVSSDVTHPGHPNSSMYTGGALGFNMMDDPEHARLRRMVTAPFAIKRIDAMRPAVQGIVDSLIDDLLAGPKPVDLMEAFALPVPSLVICELLGVPYRDHEFFQATSGKLFSRAVSVEERTTSLAKLTGYLDELLGQKAAEPGDDLLTRLVQRIDEGELTREQAVTMGVLMLLAGHETTANMIALSTLALLEHPDQLALLRDSDDPKLVARAVEELLRYLNITHYGRRRVAVADIEVGGQVIRAGEGIIAANDAGNRDPGAFADPDRLDLRRDARHHIAFGFGVHQCLGQPLVRMELQIVYRTLYRRIPTLRVAAGLDEIPFKHDGAVYGVYELPVTW